MKQIDMLQWAVVYTIDGKHYDNGQPRTGVVALFDHLTSAKDYITKAAPEETRSRFRVVHASTITD